MDLTPSAIVTPDQNNPAPQTTPVAPPPQIPQQQVQQGPVQSAPAQQQQPPTPQQQQLAHSALIGHGFKSLINSMSGSSTQYVQSPNGPQAVEVPNKPGQFFKNILAGAIMGGVAGGSVPGSETAGSGWMGAAKGAGAAMQNVQQQQQQRQQDAQKQFENSQAASKESREQMMVNAQIANMQSETAVRQHLSDLQDKEYHDKHNAASSALYGSLKEAGGVAPIDGKLPEDMTAYDLSRAYSKDPSIRQAPQGYTRHFIDKTDSDEVTWNGEHWTHPDGTPADMTDKTSIQVLDVPMDAMKTKFDTLGSDINKLTGQKLVDPAAHFQLSGTDKVALNTERLKNENEAAKTKHEGQLVATQARQAANEALKLKHDEYDAAYNQAKLQNEQLAKIADNPLSDPTEKAKAQGQIDGNNNYLKQLYQQTYPDTKLPKTEEAPPPDPVLKIVDVAQRLPDPAKALEMIKNAPISEDQKKSATKKYNDWLSTQPKPQQVTLPGIIKGAAAAAKDNLHHLETFVTGNQ